MITLNTAATPNGWKPSVAPEELGLPYHVRAFGLGKGERKAADHLRTGGEEEDARTMVGSALRTRTAPGSKASARPAAP